MELFLLFVIAIAPPVIAVLLLYYLDYHEREHPLHVLWAFFCGILIFLPVWLIELGLERWIQPLLFPVGASDLFTAFLHVFLFVALVEEGVKFLFTLLLFYPRSYFNEPFDGIVYATAIGMGLAMVENCVYVLDGGVGVGISRMLLTIPGHATWSILMGYYLGLAKFRVHGKMFLKGLALFFPVLLHSLYDAPLFQQQSLWLYLITPLVVLIGLYYAKRAIRFHQQISPFAQTEEVQ